MKKILLYSVALFVFGCAFAQKNTIQLSTEYGSKNKELQDILHFQEIETIKLKFSGEQLKGKNYTFLLKEFTNGTLAKIDTLVDSKSSEYIPAIQNKTFELKYFVQTKNDNEIKMSMLFPGFSTEKFLPIRKSEDKYALHDFLGGKKQLSIEKNKPTYILGYFLPYIHESGFKSYCDVSGSKYKPEEWGKKLGVPNYFLIEVKFN